MSRIIEGVWILGSISWSAGDPYPHGVWLRDYSYWCFSHTVENERDFFAELEELCKWLLPMQSFIDELRETGGTIHANIGLCGSANIDASLPSELAQQVGHLGITLDIEVLPTMDARDKGVFAPWRTPAGVPWWLDFHDSTLLSVDRDGTRGQGF